LTPSQIITKHGGPSKLAALVGRSPGAVRLWKFRDYFPREAWPELQAIGIKLEDLKKMERARKR
jgi:hypothetical protein